MHLHAAAGRHALIRLVTHHSVNSPMLMLLERSTSIDANMARDSSSVWPAVCGAHTRGGGGGGEAEIVRGGRG